MPDLPRTGAAEWEPEQQTPWFTVNAALRANNAFCVRVTVTRRDSVPPADCADGECFFIAAGASGDWAGYEGGVAIATGADASNGWQIVPADLVEQEGNSIFVVEEGRTLRRQNGEWIEGLEVLVDVSYAQDGDVIKWDGSNGQFYVAAP